MDLKAELFTFLTETAHANSDAERNRQLISFHYGFGEEAWPTVETTAAKFKRKKQLADQVIKNYFVRRALLHPEKFPTATKIANLLRDSAPISARGFHAILEGQGISTDGCYPRGMLNLLHDLHLCRGHDLFTHNLDPVTRPVLSMGGDFFFLDSASTTELRPELEKLRGAPSSVGVANFKSFEKMASPKHVGLLRELLTAFPEKWAFTTNDNNLWFLFEDRANTLFNDLQKIHAVVGSFPISVTELSGCLRNALDTRADPENEFPPKEIIEAYIRKSNFLNVESDYALFKSGFPKGQLTKTEEAARRFLSEVSGGHCESPPLIEYLHEMENAGKVIRNSPFIYIDKTRSKHHIFRLIGGGTHEQANELQQILDAPETERIELLKSRIGQGKFRQSLINLRRHCYVTGISDERFLRASHIVAWGDRDATNESRIDPYNGLLLAPNYDHLFDKAYITFNDEGRLLVSDTIPMEIRAAFNLAPTFVENFHGVDLGPKTKKYLAHHRKRFHERA